MAILISSKRRWMTCLGLILFIFLPPGGSLWPAQALIPREYEIKAAFLFNFTQFVTWPPASLSRPAQPFLIGLLGDDPFGVFLDETVRGEKVDGHPLVVRRYHSVKDVKGCQLLFISRSESKKLGEILASVREKGVLTVGDTEGFIQKGGVIRFFSKENKIHFKVSLEAAKRANLAISSKMLRLAEIAKPGKD